MLLLFFLLFFFVVEFFFFFAAAASVDVAARVSVRWFICIFVVIVGALLFHEHFGFLTKVPIQCSARVLLRYIGSPTLIFLEPALNWLVELQKYE